ncbi:MAG: hypothetical protein Kow0092_33910 [Deferrisomatales bacterium]
MKATSVRLDDAVLERLDRLAREMSRPRSWVISQAIERYLDYEEWFLEAVQEGVRAADAGRRIPHAAVRRWVEGWGTEEESEPPKCGG